VTSITPFSGVYLSALSIRLLSEQHGIARDPERALRVQLQPYVLELCRGRVELHGGGGEVDEIEGDET
jgi:hypothetical protein